MGIISRLLRKIGIGHHIKPRSKKRHIRVNPQNKVILALVNKERRKRHLAPVVFDPDLERHAVKWSRHMAKEGRLSHSGYILENACMAPGGGSPTTIAKRMFHIWRGSKKGHWEWMMNPGVKKAGFGYWKRGRYAYGAYAFNNP